MTTFTCVNCQIKLPDVEAHREHYKTDWHRYNLKRRVAELPPVTAEAFQARVLSMRSAQEKELQESQMNNYCNACRKQFSNEKALDNHLNSKKHKDNLERFQKEHANAEVEITTKFIPTQRQHPAHAAAAAGKGTVTIVKSETMVTDGGANSAANDDDEYEDVEEEEEIDSDEWEKLNENPITEKECLFCKNSSEDLVENLKHMSVEHSFFIPDAEYCTNLEGLLSYLGEKVANYFMCLWCNDRGKTFYSLDAVRKHMIDKGHCQMLHEGEALAEYADYYDYSSSYPDHQEGMDVDEEVTPDVLDGDEYQLVLPSGAVIGHRSLLRYYKQRLNPERALVPKKSDRKLHHVLNEYRALGWTQAQQHAVARRVRDIQVLKRAQSKWQMKLGVRANKLQKHYRAQVLF